MHGEGFAGGPDLLAVLYAVFMGNDRFHHIVVIVAGGRHIQDRPDIILIEMTLGIALQDVVHDPCKTSAADVIRRLGADQLAAGDPAFCGGGAEIGIIGAVGIQILEREVLGVNRREEAAENLQQLAAAQVRVRMEARTGENADVLQIGGRFEAGIVFRNIHKAPAAGFFRVQEQIENVHKLAHRDGAVHIENRFGIGFKIGDMLLGLKGGEKLCGEDHIAVYGDRAVFLQTPVGIQPAEEGIAFCVRFLRQNDLFAVIDGFNAVLLPRDLPAHFHRAPVGIGRQLGLRQADQPDDRTEKRRLYENQEPYQPGGFPLFTGGFGGGKLRRALRIRRKRGTDGDLLPGPVPVPQRAALPFTVR